MLQQNRFEVRQPGAAAAAVASLARHRLVRAASCTLPEACQLRVTWLSAGLQATLEQTCCQTGPSQAALGSGGGVPGLEKSQKCDGCPPGLFFLMQK